MNSFSAIVFAAVVAVASAGLLGAPLATQYAVQAPLATYSNYGARISQSARAYAAPQVAYAAPQVAYAAPQVYAHAPAAIASTYSNRVSQSARPYTVAAAPVAYAQAAPVAYAQQAIAAPAFSSIGYGYNGAVGATLLH